MHPYRPSTHQNLHHLLSINRPKACLNHEKVDTGKDQQKVKDLLVSVCQILVLPICYEIVFGYEWRKGFVSLCVLLRLINLDIYLLDPASLKWQKVTKHYALGPLWGRLRFRGRGTAGNYLGTRWCRHSRRQRLAIGDGVCRINYRLMIDCLHLCKIGRR